MIATARAARIAAGVAIAALSVPALLVEGWVRWLAAVELAAALLFCLPRVWRLGAFALLGVFAVALTHHALRGQFAASLFFAALVVVMTLAHEGS